MDKGKKFRCLVLSASKEVSEETAKMFCQSDEFNQHNAVYEDYEINTLLDWVDNKHSNIVADALILRVRSTKDWIDLREYVVEKNLIQLKIVIYDEDEVVSEVQEISPTLKFKANSQSDTEIISEIVRVDRELKAFILKMFKNFDKNGDGVIDLDEIYLVCKELGVEVTRSEFEETLFSIDKNNDNKVQYEEFSDWFKKGRQSSKLFRNIISLKLKTSNFMDNIVNTEVFTLLKEQIELTEKEIKETVTSYLALHIEKINREPEIEFKSRGYLGGDEKEKASLGYLDWLGEGLRSNDFFIVLQFKIIDLDQHEYCYKFLNMLSNHLSELLSQSYRLKNLRSNLSVKVIKVGDDVICLSLKIKKIYKEQLMSFDNAMKLLTDKDISQTLYFSFVTQGDFVKDQEKEFLDTDNIASSLEFKLCFMKKNWRVISKLLHDLLPGWLKLFLNSMNGFHLEFNMTLDYLKSQEHSIYKEAKVKTFIQNILSELVKSFLSGFGGLNTFHTFFSSIKHEFELVINTPHIFNTIKLDYDKIMNPK